MVDILLGRLAGQREGPGILVLDHGDMVRPVGTRAGPLPFRI
jgi:hypothetical protein